jgi:hypothetical protein
MHMLCLFIKINMSFHVVILQRDTKGWYSRKCSIINRTLLLVSSAEEQDAIEMSERKKIEDEMHFLMSCSKYDKTRQDLFSIVGMTCINFQNLSIEKIFLWLMTCESDLVLKEMCQCICKYCRWFFFFLTFLFHLVLLHWTRGVVFLQGTPRDGVQGNVAFSA